MFTKSIRMDLDRVLGTTGVISFLYFTIGEWVDGQYVQGFKQGNLYYKPIYDKGYNFSRRYLPDQNVSSFLNQPIPQSNYGNFDDKHEVVKPTVIFTMHFFSNFVPVMKWVCISYMQNRQTN